MVNKLKSITMKLSHYLVILLFLSGFTATAQIDGGRDQMRGSSKGILLESDYSTGTDTDSKTTKSIKIDTKASDYKFISELSDTTYVDTTLSIKKEFRHNYLRKDYFELLPFSNTGQAFNRLGYDFISKNNTFSLFVAQAKQHDFKKASDISYYHVATPLTELFLKTTFEQGQLAEGFFTVNTTPQFNIAVSYKGLRSLGTYRHAKTNSSQFITALSYNTKNERYKIKAHMSFQSLENQENGGLTETSLLSFKNKDEEFDDRSRFEVNFEDATNELSSKRFYVSQEYNLIKQQDSLTNNRLSVGYSASLEDKKYNYNQASAHDFFGASFLPSIADEVRLEQFVNKAHVSYSNQSIGILKSHIAYTDYNYGYNSIVVFDSEIIKNRLKSGFTTYGISYNKTSNKLQVSANGLLNLTSNTPGKLLNATVLYSPTEKLDLKGSIQLKEALPDFNFRLFQSDYKNYNWYNPDMKLEHTSSAQLVLDAKKFGTFTANHTVLKNYTYFGLTPANTVVSPMQELNEIKYLKLTAYKEFVYGKFALNNTVQYQKVSQQNQVLHVPEWLLRSTVYFTDSLFGDNLFLQTGLTFQYFSAYNMNAYDPVLSSFYSQSNAIYGAYPRIDFFINAKVRNARIYLKAEHLNSSFTGNNFYSAPNYPYRDFSIRFGLVWDFFL